MADPEKNHVHLVVKSGPDKGRAFILEPKKEVLVGRSPEAQLRLSDGGVSYKHCVVRSAGNMIFIEDLKSRNGTIVNGEITSMRALHENGSIEVGSTTIDIRWEGSEPLAKGTGILPATDAPKPPPSRTTMMLRNPAGGTMVLNHPHDHGDHVRVGKIVGDYLMLEVIGTGGMGTIYRAKSVKTRSEAAVKIISRSLAKDPALLQRFLRETKTGLTIPHAVQVLSVGESGESAYVGMELVRGRSLRSLLDGGKHYTPGDAVRMLLPLCETLQVMHEQNLLHGDVKPLNVLITEKDGPRLLDVGLGPKTDKDGNSILLEDWRIEKLQYAAPEVVTHQHSDARADLYSFAATIFFSLIGQPPFDATSDEALIKKIVSDPAPLLSDLRKDIPEALTAVIARALSKDPNARFGKVSEFAALLRAAVPAESTAIAAGPANPSSTPDAPVAAAASNAPVAPDVSSGPVSPVVPPVVPVAAVPAVAVPAPTVEAAPSIPVPPPLPSRGGAAPPPLPPDLKS